MDHDTRHISMGPRPRPPLNSLLALPSEIIRAVVEIVGASVHQTPFSVEHVFVPTDWADVVNLGLCCRALHELAAPIYQRRLMISERVPFTDLVCPPLSPRPEWQWLCDQRPNAHLARQQCERLCVAHAQRLARVASLGYSCLIATGDDETDREMMPETLVDATCNLLAKTTQLSFLCLDGITGRLIDAMLSTNLIFLRALALNRIHAAGPSGPKPYPILARLRALKLNYCNQAWLALIPHAIYLEDLAIRGQICDLDWFQATNLLPRLRYLNIQDRSLPLALVLDLCDRIHTHRQSGEPIVLQELSLLSGFTLTAIRELCSCLRGHTGLRSLKFSVNNEDPDEIVLILESISKSALVNLRYFELTVDPQSEHIHMFPFSPSSSVLESLRKLTNLQTLVLHAVWLQNDISSPTSHEVDNLPPDAAWIFENCPSLETITHSCLCDEQSIVFEAHRKDKEHNAVPLVETGTGEGWQAHGLEGFERRWAD